MSEIPTIKIKDGADYAIINQDDFDPAIHEALDAGPVESPAPDRDAIAKMPKGEVREWLEAHGAEIAKGATVDEMRAQLIATIFVDV